MAIDFPTSPTDGQTYTYSGKSWVYTADYGVWSAISQNISGIGGNVLLNSGFDTWQRGNNHTATITGATASGTAITYTVATNTFIVGEFVSVTGITPTALNMSGSVTAATGTTFTLASPATGTYTSGGTATGTLHTLAATNTYTADRWVHNYDGSGATRNIYKMAFVPGAGDITGYNPAYFLRCDQTVAGTGGTINNIQQRILDVRTFSGNTVTVSFWAKAAASTSITTTISKYYGVGGSTTETGLNSQSYSLTTSWARYTATFTLASIASKTIVGDNTYLGLTFNLPLNATSTVDIWGVQLEQGSLASIWSRPTATVIDEENICTQYYKRYIAQGATTRFSRWTPAKSTTQVDCLFDFGVRMIQPPTAIESGGTLNLSDSSATFSVTSPTLGNATKDMATITVTTTGLTQFRPYAYSSTAINDYLAFYAEL